MCLKKEQNEMSTIIVTIERSYKSLMNKRKEDLVYMVLDLLNTLDEKEKLLNNLHQELNLEWMKGYQAGMKAIREINETSKNQ
jgi:hypothetical protein